MRIKDYFTPKSFIYTGIHDDVSTTIKHYHYENELEITNSFEKKSGKSYIQVVGLTDINKIETLKEQFQIDPLLFEDIFSVSQRVKIEDKKTYQFSTYHILHESQGVTHEDYISMLLLEDTLISFHEKEPVYLEALYPLLKDYDELKKRSIDFLYYQILDIITDKHLEVLESKNMTLDTVEAEILESKKVNQEDFYLIRKNLLRLKSITTPVVAELEKAMKNMNLYQKENMPYFEDLKDHLNRLYENLNESRELMRHLLDLHINNQSNQMNEIMKTLTLFSAIFIPLSFLTGFFGMNFTDFEVLNYEDAVLFFVIGSILLVTIMLYFFKRMRYFK